MVGIACFTLFCAVLLSLASYGASAYHKKSNVPAMFVFGDSLLDSGTNNYIVNTSFRANFAPYGQNFFHKEATGRFTNGQHFGDFMAHMLGLPLPLPYLSGTANIQKGVNFASAGSGFLNSTNEKFGVVNFAAQLDQFMQTRQELVHRHGENSTVNLLSGSLYLIASGSNDVIQNYLANSDFMTTVPPTDFAKILVSEYTNAITKIYQNGGRKIVAIGLGPLGCIPAVLASSNSTDGSCVSGPNQLATGINGALQQSLEVLRNKLRGSVILYANAFDSFNNLIEQSSKKYGVMESKNACCGAGTFNGLVQCGLNGSTVCSQPSQFIFWDFFHPSQYAYRSFSKVMWQGDTKSIFPMNISSLAYNY